MLYICNSKRPMYRSFFITLSLIFFIFLSSCTSKKNVNDEVLEKKILNPNLEQRAKENAGKNPLFGSSRKKDSGTFEFGTSNVMWRATLKTLDFIPLNNTDYSGGMIVTDWYGNSSEQIKISVQFLSNELRSTSIKVIAHKKKCKENNCFTEPANDSFNIEIKDKILNEARAIKINDDKTKK